jgi:glycosyltransferase involved in cell wall biosynthesis
VVIYDSPTYYHLVGALRECLSVYIAVDDLTVTVTGERIPGELEAERQLLGKVGLVFCVSEVLAERLRERSPSNSSPPIRVLPNGYDERLFDPNRDWTEPDALGDIPKPRILVAGHISERIDWDGIIGASQLRQNWNWVFVGPTDKEMTGKIANALGKKGFYHPPIPVTEVPAWISHCDACAVPYRLNPFTRASHPLKAIEYLAMGAVVLSTRIPSLERYNGVIEWVNEGDAESYARALDELANQAGSQEIRHLRQRAVSGDSLGVRVNQFREIVINAIP